MIGQEILRLPEIPEGTPEAQLRAIRSYLYRLAKQLQYLLSTKQEARIRGQEVCSQEAFREIQQKILDSPQIARQSAGNGLGDGVRQPAVELPGGKERPEGDYQ